MIVEIEITKAQLEAARDASNAAGDKGIYIADIPAYARIVRGPNATELLLTGKTSIAYEDTSAPHPTISIGTKEP